MMDMITLIQILAAFWEMCTMQHIPLVLCMTRANKKLNTRHMTHVTLGATSHDTNGIRP